MFLKSLKLNNIRCFGEVFIDFDLPGGDNRKWTVLTGENGTGKSTILKSIALVLAGSDALPDLIGDPDSWISGGASSGAIVAEIETAGGKQRAIELEFKRGEGLSKLINRSVKSLGPLNDALEHTNRSYLTIGFGSSRRLGTASLSSKSRPGPSHPRSQSMISLFDPSATLNPLESWAMQIDYNSNGIGLETIRKVLSDFLPEMQFSHIDKRNETLIFKTEDGEIPLRSLSDGYQSVAAWVGDLLYQITNIFEDYKDPLSARGLLIIDEIDLHLHPKWQRRLLDFLQARLPKMQLVVTTHSVIIAQQAPQGALHYCVRRDGQPAVERFDIDPGDLLLNQLIATEAFGQMSDESLQVETLKSEYREIHNKSAKSGTDIQRMAVLTGALRSRPEDKDAAVSLNREQRELMEKILSSQSE
eukprot:TRINITY_DN21991_c0_g1_i1.p1 TRINITY_DN21991_c0_g1~~TRINITY_DN21991_c0_g1_i1.p1  ORF type:complete len:417 (+),score=14.57 TRINITY_DN21991_c0_g1_i1:740-1990(+)